jgi:hypothetical protein
MMEACMHNWAAWASNGSTFWVLYLEWAFCTSQGFLMYIGRRANYHEKSFHLAKQIY